MQKSIELETQREIAQNHMFEMLIEIFTPGYEISNFGSEEGNHVYFKTSNGVYTVESKPTRHECIVKENGNVLFEIYTLNEKNLIYRVFSKGKILKHLHFDDELLLTLKNRKIYHKDSAFKHSFRLNKDDTIKTCTSFKYIDYNYDNHLINTNELEVTS